MSAPSRALSAGLAALTASLTAAFACGPTARPQPTPPPPGDAPPEPVAIPGSFVDNPIVYFVLTDRFLDGDPRNNRSYGRAPDGENEIGTFHGGDLAGLTRKLEEGYFRELGVNALWISAPYQQILGWVIGGNKEFRHYAYHGYYALDFTVLDANMGTEDELRRMIDAAHAQGIRVVFDVVMNHPGYADLTSMTTFGIDVVWKGWEDATPATYGSYIDYNNFAFGNWWGAAWVRSDLPGYTPGGRDDLTKQLAFLPDFRTESPEPVELPWFLQHKPDTKAVARPGATVRDYLVEWLTRWVRDFGVDGFRCDTAKHVELESWTALKAAGVAALAAWKREHPAQKIDDAPFWMTAEVFPHDVTRDAYFDAGFDNVINFDFQRRAKELGDDDWAGLDALYAEYARALRQGPPFNVLSYLSSHDTELFPRARLIAGITKLLLAPGGVQLFYGDEAARAPGPAPSSDPQQATRSSMRWERLDDAVLARARALGTFRRRHVALAKGAHQRLGEAPYTFARVHEQDRVVVALGGSGVVAVPVAGVFEDGAQVADAMTGQRAQVRGGVVEVTSDRGVILLERVAAP
ncbi:MAG: alpha-amylase family glycosyl hydrolase [Kofleriaceae bacterium]